MSRARRDSEGRLLGRSALLGPASEEIYIRRNAVPAHAFSETDRLLARPAEFARDGKAISAPKAWRTWHPQEITPHDGLVTARTEERSVRQACVRTDSSQVSTDY